MASQTINDNTNYVAIATFAGRLPIALTLTVYGGPLTHLLLEAQVTPDAPWQSVKEDAGFNTVDNLLAFVLGASYLSGTFTLGLNGGFFQYRISGKAVNANVQYFLGYVS